MKFFFTMIGLHVQGFFRKLLGVNDDMLLVREDFTKLVEHFQSLNQDFNTLNNDLWSTFHALPFTAGILTLNAANAAKMTNPKVGEPNALVPILTSILLKTRQGESQLEVRGELAEFVKAELKSRGFQIETPQSSDGKSSSTFILWT